MVWYFLDPEAVKEEKQGVGISKDFSYAVVWSPQLFPNNTDKLGQVYMTSMLKGMIEDRSLVPPVWVAVTYKKSAAEGGQKFFHYVQAPLKDTEHQLHSWSKLAEEKGMIIV